MNRTVLLATLAVLVPAASLAAAPQAGVAQKIQSGFFADVNLGGFFTVGGRNSSNSSKPSNAQAYLQLGLGYDIAKNFALGLTFGIGSSAAACFAQVNSGGQCVVDATVPKAKAEVIADNFTATMFVAEISYKHWFTDRLTLQPRLEGGYATLDPEPRRDQNGNPIKGGAVGGVGVGIEYATHMDHFSIGADMYWRMIIGPNIHSIAIYPKVKYTF